MCVRASERLAHRVGACARACVSELLTHRVMLPERARVMCACLRACACVRACVRVRVSERLAHRAADGVVGVVHPLHEFRVPSTALRERHSNNAFYDIISI